MNENDKIQDFGDMVSASQKIVKPWIVFCGLLLAALILTNAIWGFVHWKQLQYAYETPIEFEQGQQFEEQTQSQSYKEGATPGN